MTNLRRLVITAGMALAIAGFAGAASLETQTFTLPAGSNATSWSGSANINQFNTSLGTLEWISFAVQVNATATATNTDANPGSSGTDTYVFGGTTQITFSDVGDGNIFSTLGAFTTQTFTNQGFGSVQTVTADPASTSNSAKYIVDTSNILNSFCGADPGTAGCLFGGGSSVDPLDYSAFEGVSYVTLSGSASNFASFSGPSYSGGAGSGTATMLVTVTYDYIPAPPPSTPEPATMALFGSGLIGLGLLRRRATKK